MDERIKLLSNFVAKEHDISNLPSINGLRKKELNGEPLTVKEKQALINFDKFRLYVLNAQTDDALFQKHYQQLQVMANLGDYTEFLNEEYFL